MEFDDNDGFADNEDDYVEIYSRKAIFWFAVFSPLFAAILLMINLWVAGFKSAMYQVLGFIIVWSFANFLLANLLQGVLHVDLKATTITPGFVYLNLISFALNVVFGFILTRFFFKKYFPDNDYYPRSIQTPLFIFISFIFFFVFVIGFSL